MSRLTAYDPTDPPPPAGGSFRVRAQAEWGNHLAARPTQCVYDHVGVARRLVWDDTNEGWAGRTATATGGLGSGGLPLYVVAGWPAVELHPDWVEALPPATDPLGAPCTCDRQALMHRGCTCGRFSRERAAR